MADKTFTEKQREVVARKMGYEGPMQMFDEYLNSSPSEARKYAMIGTKFMARGGMVRKYAEGGVTLPANYQEARDAFKKQQEADAQKMIESGQLPPPSLTVTGKDQFGQDFNLAADADAFNTFYNANYKTTTTPPTSNVPTTNVPAGKTTTNAATGMPVQPTAAQVAPALQTVQPGQTLATELAPTQAAQATAGAPITAATTTAPTITPTATMEAVQAAPAVKLAADALQPAQGAVSQQAQVQAAQATPTETAVGQLDAAQGLTRQVTGAPVRGEQVGEMISGPAVNMAQVENTLAKAEAAQGVVTEDMTVQGQLAKLTAGFESGNPPSWAAASLRNATAQMAARGLGASSLAGQAIIQATLEAAVPIASADAQVFQQMGMQNLSNRQQVAVLTAQQRAQFLGQEFDQAFQTRVANAARVADIANMNFTAQQQVALENARLAQTMDLANLNNRQAIVMAEAAQIANLETQNLNNRQQAAVVNAQSFLQMDMANLSNEQQAEMFKAQSNIQSILTDQAAVNASRQFNASSQNQADQFFANLTAQVKQFNTQQTNAMSQFNVDQANTVSKFNAEVQNQRDQFNAQNRLVIDQSNAQWRREISTANTAAINRANEFNATKAMEVTMVEYNNMWQQFRDEIEYSWKSAENAADRVNQVTRQEISSNATILAATMAKDAEITKTIGTSAATILSGTSGAKVFGEIFNWGYDKGKELINWAGGLFNTTDLAGRDF
jgi:hypothetical protein